MSEHPKNHEDLREIEIQPQTQEQPQSAEERQKMWDDFLVRIRERGIWPASSDNDDDDQKPRIIISTW